MPQTIVITGASSGIGLVAAHQLAAAGERVVMVGPRGGEIATRAEEVGAAYHGADYTDLAQVRQLAEELRETYPKIDVLANNAGGMFAHRELTADGFETTFQVNYLAGFLLTKLLLPRLVESRGKVIQTSSLGAKTLGNIDINDLQNEHRFSPNKAYGDSKLAYILFTRELHRRYNGQGLSAVAFHPGIVATNIAQSARGIMHFVYHNPVIRRFLVKPEQGGARLTWLARGEPGKDWQSGQYYERNRIAKTHPQADDRKLAAALWERSEEMTKSFTTP